MNHLLIMPLLFALAQSTGANVVDRILAQVNNDIITLSDMRREMADVRRELEARYTGDQLEAEARKMEKEVLEELINQKLLLQKATELGFGANVDLQVSAYIESFRKKNNIRDMQEFEMALQQQGMTLAAYREYLRKQIITSGLVNEFVGSRITLLPEEIERFYRDHSADYATPEEVTLSEIVIPVEGSDAEAAAKAGEIHKRLSQGEPFATLASQFSKGTTAAKGGDIGSYVTSKLNPEIAKVIAPVKAGEVSAVTKAREGYVIYRVDARKEASVRPLEAVREDIRNRLWQQKFQPEYERFMAQLREDAYIQIFEEIR